MKKRILVIDNDKNYSNMLVGWLRDLDYEPTACASLEEAKERIAQEYYHVLMVDIRMKDDSDPDDFSGFQIIQNENYRSIPKIISTSHREAAFHEMWGDQVTNREDVYFISKSDDSQVRRGLLEQVFAKVEDDFDLRFRFNERTAVSFYHLTSHLFTQEPTERLPAYSVIFEALLRRIFHGNRQVTLNRIYCVEKDTLTMSAYCYGSGLVVQPTGYLVHFGRREVVSEGVKRNPRQVQYHPQSQPLLGNPSTLAETHGLAAVAYEFLNVELEGVQTLEQVIGETNHEQLRSLLSTLKETYFDNLHPRSAKKRPVKDLAIYYDELLTQTHGNNLLKRLEQNIG
ncbi:MAG: response regulator, partial [Anaerolineae bacterium]|nr:response regulator [Anaerolineae bacterium]